MLEILKEFGWLFLQELLVNLLIPALVALVGAWLVQQVRLLTLRLKNERPELYWYLAQAAELGVKAAEQMGLSEQIEEKKDYAVKVAQVYLDDRGIKIDLALVEAAIEKAVLELNQADQKVLE